MAIHLDRPRPVVTPAEAGPTPDSFITDTRALGAVAYVVAAFWEEAASRALTRLAEERRPSPDDAPAALAALGGAERARGRSAHVTALVLDHGDSLWLVFAHHGVDSQWYATVAGATDEAVDAAVGRIREVLPEVVDDDPAVVHLRFWVLSSGEPTWFRRAIPAEAWETLAPNYPAAARAPLDRLVRTERPGAGKLVLLHGPPGTGKTTFIRSLTRAWLPWADPAYVVDPEQFFATSSYLLSVVTDQFSDDGDDRGTEPRWKLLVIEDADELLLADAKERSGQALSRLLNLTDGLIGEGLRLVLLITTNVDYVSLHPALRRPGRCLANVAVGVFAPDEATAWLARQGVDDPRTQPATLAELYEACDPRQVRVDPAATPVPGYL